MCHEGPSGAGMAARPCSHSRGRRWVERRPDQRVARILFDTYLLGDSRESLAAAQALIKRARDL